MHSITVKEIETAIAEALKKFGTHNFWDKGAWEVMDVEGITKRMLEEHSHEKCEELLLEVSKLDVNGEKGAGAEFVKDALHCAEAIDDAFLDYLDAKDSRLWKHY